MIIGIDPGIAGAIVAISDDGETIEAWADMPTRPRLNGKGNELDCCELEGALAAMSEHCAKRPRVYLEQVGPMPGQGVTSMFHMGETLAFTRAVLELFAYPTVMIRPATWKRAAGLIKRPKAASRALAQQLWPERRDIFSRAKDDGRADAALIAYYGRLM